MSGGTTIDANALLHQLRALSARVEQAEAQAPGGAPATDFSEVLKRSLDQVNEAQQAAVHLGQAYETGDPGVSTADLMLGVQKASLSFQAATQVRNKLVAAYQDIMSMQV